MNGIVVEARRSWIGAARERKAKHAVRLRSDIEEGSSNRVEYREFGRSVRNIRVALLSSSVAEIFDVKNFTVDSTYRLPATKMAPRNRSEFTQKFRSSCRITVITEPVNMLRRSMLSLKRFAIHGRGERTPIHDRKVSLTDSSRRGYSIVR